MNDEEQPPRDEYPLTSARPKLSTTPSWVMLGFALGALFVYALMRPDPAAKPAPPPVAVRFVEAPTPTAPREPAPLTEIEAVFAMWGEHAVWSEDTTEVVYWNKRERAFTDYFEVRRSGGNYYFRSIPRLTRRIVMHGKEFPESPLQFTETEEQYQEWRQHGRTERRPDRSLRPLIEPPPQGPRPGVAPPKVVSPKTLPPPPLEPVIGLTPAPKK
jgi:hypothetical protein